MANETIAHIPYAECEEMSWNNAQKQENSLVQMAVQTDTHVVHSLLWPSQNTAQTQRHH